MNEFTDSHKCCTMKTNYDQLLFLLLPPHKGRNVAVPRAVLGRRVCRFTFDELCGSAVGAADYLALSGAFHTVFLEGVPVMGMRHLNQVCVPT
jgi:predicted ATPase